MQLDRPGGELIQQENEDKSNVVMTLLLIYTGTLGGQLSNLPLFLNQSETNRLAFSRALR